MGNDGAYRTDDLALAVVFALAGFKYELQSVAETRVLWEFTPAEDRDEEFDEILDHYQRCIHKVEPHAFVLRWGQMRSEMFAMLPPRPPRRPVAPSAT